MLRTGSSFWTLLVFVLFGLFFCSQVKAAQEKDFSEWLKENNALDAYARSLEDQPDNPETILRRSRALFALGRYSDSRNLLEQNKTKFSGPENGRRLILLGQIYRSMQEFDRSVDSFSRALDYLDQDTYQEKLNNISGLKDLYIWSWKKNFWTSLAPETFSEGKLELLTTWAKAALSAWPESRFWDICQKTCARIRDSEAGPSLAALSGYTQKISRLFAYWSLQDFQNSGRILAGLQTEHPRDIWYFFDSYLESDQFSIDLPQNGTSRARAFTSVFAWQLKTLAEENRWVITYPDLSGWEKYRKEISSLSPQESLDSLQKEYDSALLAPEVKSALGKMILAYRLILGESERISQNNIPEDLPLCLRISLALAEKDPRAASVKQTDYIPMIREILLASGMQSGFSGIYTPWKSVSGEKDEDKVSLDYLDNYIRLGQNTDSTSDKALAFLYPNTPLGQSAFLRLAREAYKQGYKKTAWDYLQRIQSKKFPAENESELLKAKAGILMDLGREDESLKTYATLLKRYPRSISPQKRLKLALAAQQKNKWKWADEILKRLWEEREELSSPLRAEVLFWIAEGEQMRGNIDSAIDSYLRVAWKYPGENIWAVTAAYRAAQLYEKRDMLNTARNLYEMVLKRSDRDSQKKAAKQRLNAIDAAKEKQGEHAPLF
jgi:tetratricopeptide (TPR) repeat protein